jgi:hypothetical protein
MRVRLLLLLALVIFLPACGNKTPVEPAPVEAGDALKELGEVYHYLAAQKLPPPRRVEHLNEYSGSLEGALPKIRAGDIVVVWGVGYAAGSNQVLAYPKDVAEKDGPVLLRNGTVKQMTAEEFKAAPKAK